MASVVKKAINKLPGTSERSNVDEPTNGADSSINDRKIPLEPIQKHPSGSNSFHPDVLEQHNVVRANKGNQALAWDKDLAKDAQAYAQQLAESEKLEHSGTKGQGENLFESSDDASFVDALKHWLDEEKNYNGEQIGESNLQKYGHFSKFTLSEHSYRTIGCTAD